MTFDAETGDGRLAYGGGVPFAVDTTDDERAIFRLPSGVDVADTCVVCAAPFEKRKKTQVTCGEERCRKTRHDHQKRKRLNTLLPSSCEFCQATFQPRNERQTACSAAECRKKVVRKRFDTWYAKPENAERHRRNTSDRRSKKSAQAVTSAADPWAAPPPACGKHLPGGAMSITFDPPREVAHRHARLLHGIVSHALAVPHGQATDFSLLHVHRAMSASGWGVHVRDDATARALAGRTVDASFGRQRARVAFGPLVRLLAPRVGATGRHRVRVDAVTPVVIRSNGRAGVFARRPTRFSIWSALTQAFPARLGIELDAHAVGLDVVASQTEVVYTPMGKIGGGCVVGWSGSVTLDVNPIARWLLECASRIGLGGKTAFGFGRIRVTEVADDAPIEGEAPTIDDVDVVSMTAAEKYAAARGITVEQAMIDLTCAVDAATFVERISGGAELWQHEGLRLVVRPGPLRAPRVVAAIQAGDPVVLPVVDDEPGIHGRFFVTPHAVDRYIERVMLPSGASQAEIDAAMEDAKTRRQALAELIDLTSAGRYVDAWTGDPKHGEGPFELWRAPKLGTNDQQDPRSRLRFIVGAGQGSAKAVVTVLARHQHEAA